MARGSQKGSRNNNPEGYNQHSNGLMQAVRKNPVASAAAAGAAAAAGLFLWSKRDRIGERMSDMGDKAGRWSEKMRSSRKSSQPMGSGSARSASETGTERIGQASMASPSTAPMSGASRATGGRSGKAQSGQNMNPSRTATETVG